MNDADDRLAGDLVWELFPAQTSPTPTPRFLHVLGVGALVALTWFLSQPLAVVIACLSIAVRDFRGGWRLARNAPPKSGGTICGLFAFAWGAFKMGAVAFAALVVAIMLSLPMMRDAGMPAGVATSMLLWFGGLTSSSVLSALGMTQALRTGMRVWIGEGVNQARTLLLGMLLTGFTFFVLIPLCIMLVRNAPRAGEPPGAIPLTLTLLMACLFIAPVGLLVFLDWTCTRVLAKQPAKFGPKVPAVGKWAQQP